MNLNCTKNLVLAMAITLGAQIVFALNVKTASTSDDGVKSKLEVFSFE